MNSFNTFYADGFNAGYLGLPASVPDDIYRTLEDGSREYSSVNAQDYLCGYRDGQEHAEVA